LIHDYAIDAISNVSFQGRTTFRLPFLRSSAFRERFLAKGRMATLLESVPIHVITHPHPGLLGAACALRASES
jgi:glucokinase